MSLLTRPLKAGDLHGVIITFENSGDVLGMHEHSAADVHITVVARGRVRIHGPTIGSNAYATGAVIDFEPGHPHEVIAIEDNSRIVNIVKKTSP
jgi:quercetin dioxygenase-like cupin family protein